MNRPTIIQLIYLRMHNDNFTIRKLTFPKGMRKLTNSQNLIQHEVMCNLISFTFRLRSSRRTLLAKYQVGFCIHMFWGFYFYMYTIRPKYIFVTEQMWTRIISFLYFESI